MTVRQVRTSIAAWLSYRFININYYHSLPTMNVHLAVSYVIFWILRGMYNAELVQMCLWNFY
jgi:hypothetical protein